MSESHPEVTSKFFTLKRGRSEPDSSSDSAAKKAAISGLKQQTLSFGADKVPPPVSVPAPTPKAPVETIVIKDNSDFSSDESDFDSGFDEEEYRSKDKEVKALVFFNTAKQGTIVELSKCTPDKAQVLIQLRPFKSAEDFRSRTRKTKGLGNNLLDDYLELMKGLEDVDIILDSCEQFGQKINAVLDVWEQSIEKGKAAKAAAVEGPSGEHQTATGEISEAPKAEQAAPAPTTPGKNKKSHTPLHSYKLIDLPVRDNTLKDETAFEDFMYDQPASMSSTITLKEYQLMGINWMSLLYRNKKSCILADEMGLGKTAQIIGLISHLRDIGKKGPHLIIVPSSTLENWLREFETFAPELAVFSYYGTQAERYELRHELKHLTRSTDPADEVNVVVTTYNIATGHDDLKFLCKKVKFDCCVYDEGHQLKNSESKKYKDLMKIEPNWRVLLTGTPLQNNLQELISLLSFILPEQFKHADAALKSIFKLTPGASSSHLLLSNERIRRARQMMTPFCLRRKKSEVLTHLPKKREEVLWCDMTEEQREIYNEALLRSRKAFDDLAVSELAKLADDGVDAGADDGPKKKEPSSMVSNNILSDLRKSCNHPMLFRRHYTDEILRNMSKDCLREVEFADSNREYVFEDMQVMNDLELHLFCLRYSSTKKYALQNEEWMQAGKVKVLGELLMRMKQEGNRTLVFSQFTQVLAILELVLKTLGLKFVILTGQTAVVDRQSIVDQFTDDTSIDVFLLSTRAGGLGLNLTASNTVAFYDQDFNPHNDKQAEDRSYRIGQTRDVTIYKLITRDTLEEDMRALATSKLLLDRTVSETNGTGTGEALVEDDDMAANTALVEKKMKTSLLSALKKKHRETNGTTASPVKA